MGPKRLENERGGTTTSSRVPLRPPLPRYKRTEHRPPDDESPPGVRSLWSRQSPSLPWSGRLWTWSLKVGGLDTLNFFSFFLGQQSRWVSYRKITPSGLFDR